MRQLMFASVVCVAACAAPHRLDPRPSTPGAPGPDRPVASTPPVAATEMPSVRAHEVRTLAGITEYLLDNGLRVLLCPDPSASTVTVNATYLVGSRHEGYGETGMAHLLEHMMFKGTPTHPKVLALVDARGGSGNGSTWYDRTNYYETLPATGDNLAWAIALEADRMRNASITQEDLATEFSVVRNEFEMGENDPADILAERMVSTAYLWHNYGKSTIGSRGDIELVKAPQLEVFYDRYYQPDNAVLIVAGNIDVAATLALIEQRFGPIARPTRVLAETYTVEPVQDGEREVTLRRNGDVAIVGALYHGVGQASLDWSAMQAAASILVHEPTGALYKALVASGLAAGVEGSEGDLRDPGFVDFYAQVPDPRNVAKVQQILLDTIEQLGRTPVDPAALARWRNGEIMAFDHLYARSEALAIELSEHVVTGDWRTLFARRQQVGQVTAADVQRVARTYLLASNRTVGRFLPTKSSPRAPLQHTPDPGLLVAQLPRTLDLSPGAPFDNGLPNLAAQVHYATLPGGVQTAMLAKQTRGNRVEVMLELRFGDLQTARGQDAVAEVMAELIQRGTRHHGYAALRDALDAQRAAVTVSGDTNALSLGLYTFRDNLPAALALVFEMLQSPAFDERELQIVKRELIAALEATRTDPSTLAHLAVDRALQPYPPGDPRRVMTLDEHVAAVRRVTVANVRAFYATRVGGGTVGVVAIGEFDAPALGAQLAARLGTWRARAPYTRVPDAYFDVAAVRLPVDVPDKEMAQIAFGLNIQLRDDEPDYPAWLMIGMVLGGDTGSRLWTRIREDEGLSYGVGVWADASAFDRIGYLGGGVMVAPQNLAKAEAAITEEVAAMAAHGVTAEELTRAKAAWTASRATSRASDNALGSELLGDLFRHRTIADAATLEAAVQAVTVQDVARAGRTYLAPGKLVVAVAGDLSRAP